jgi:peptidoglycan/LPS O-acetylase OafA/YrhL
MVRASHLNARRNQKLITGSSTTAAVPPRTADAVPPLPDRRHGPARRPGGALRNERIEIVDGFRALAIALVIGFHYFSRWTPPRYDQNLYPYGPWLADVPLFSHGGLGVELFFIVSGFVISLTLHNCRDWSDFAWKRFARLFPAILLCSIVTFAVIRAVPGGPFSASFRDFLPSVTFTNPELWRRVFGVPFAQIDGAYWSLEVEVKFYFWACLIYFIGRPEGFDRRFLGFAAGALLLAALAQALGRHLQSIADFLLFPRFLPWFAAGVGFYGLYRRRSDLTAALLVAASFALLAARSTYTAAAAADLAPTSVFYALFCLFVFRPGWLAWLAAKPIVAIGAASYSLYLLHQTIGVTLLWACLKATAGSTTRISVLAAPAVAAGITLVSLAIYRYWEMPARRWILQLKSRSISPAA